MKSKKNNTDITPAEEYAINFQNPEPKYYTRVPNIIDHLTYETIVNGKKVKKRLSVYAKELYRIIRMIASEKGSCWNNTKSLAKKMNCSYGMIHKCKQELMNPMLQLDGNSLISEKRKQISRENEATGKNFKIILCTYTIVDIWSWNNAFMATLKHQDQYGEDLEEQIPESPHESGGPPESPHDFDTPGPESWSERNNISLNKNPLFKEQQHTADADSVCSSKKEKGGLLLSEDKVQTYEWLVKEGCDQKVAKDIATNYSNEEISKAVDYVNAQKLKKKAKNQKLDNRWGYFIKTLKHRYWDVD